MIEEATIEASQVSNNEVEKPSFQHVKSWISWTGGAITLDENSLDDVVIIHFNQLS
jgi:hypothetical protein